MSKTEFWKKMLYPLLGKFVYQSRVHSSFTATHLKKGFSQPLSASPPSQTLVQVFFLPTPQLIVRYLSPFPSPVFAFLCALAFQHLIVKSNVVSFHLIANSRSLYLLQHNVGDCGPHRNLAAKGTRKLVGFTVRLFEPMDAYSTKLEWTGKRENKSKYYTREAPPRKYLAMRRIENRPSDRREPETLEENSTPGKLHI